MKLIIFIILALYLPIHGQSTLKIEDCYNMAEENSPFADSKSIYDRISKQKLLNMDTKYYPDINMLAQAQYQSEVTKVELDFNIPNITVPKIPEPPKDQYKIGLSINQIIWDGGVISAGKEIELTDLEINNIGTEITLYNLREKVNESYFGVLMLDKSIKSLSLMQDDLRLKKNNIDIAVQNGMILSSNSITMEAELLKLDNKIAELKSRRRTALDILSVLIGKKLEYETKLTTPPVEDMILKENELKRKELTIFDLNSQKLEKSKSLSSAKVMPRIAAYGQAMYGQPGLNMFDPDFQPYYIVGLQASWNIWNWNTDNREQEVFSLQQELLSQQKENFSMAIDMATRKYFNEHERLKSTLIRDAEITELRKRSAGEAYSQLENGVITATEYLLEFNNEAAAVLEMEMHKIELAKIKIDYLTATGGNSLGKTSDDNN